MTKPEILEELEGFKDELVLDFDSKDGVADLREVLLDAREVSGKDSDGDNKEGRITPDTGAPQTPKEKEEEKDYLKQYEYQKSSGHPYAESARQGFPYSAPTGKALIMKGVLLKQPKIRTSISRGQGEDKGILQSVCPNGYRLDFPKNTALYLPEQIVQILEESQEITEHSADHMPTKGIE